MKQRVTFLLAAGLLALPAGAALAQSVGIGTTIPNAAAALDVTATNKGLLIPRMDSATRAQIAAPVPAGLLVYQTNGRTGFWYYTGAAWAFIPDKLRSGDNLGNHTATQNLNLQANALVGNGADLGASVGVGVTAQGGLNVGQNTGGGNMYVGYQAGQATVPTTGTFGSRNTFLGYQAGAANANGYDNLFAGYQAGAANTGQQNLFLGAYAGAANLSANDNLFVGTYAGRRNTTGEGNLFMGYAAGGRNTTGGGNQFIGFDSGVDNVSGSGNQFSGYQSGANNTTGSANYFSGSSAGLYNTTASNNHFEGYQSGILNTTGHSNLAVGTSSAYRNQTGSYNTMLGDSAGYSNRTNFNQAVGYQAGYATTTGTQNTFVGHRAGYTNTTGGNHTALGYLAGPTSAALTNTTALGYQAQVSQSNSLVLGGTGANAVRVGIGTTAPAQTLDVNGTVRVGTSTTAGTVYSPATGTHNLLAIAYGQLGGGQANVFGTSGNYSVTYIGTGSYRLAFTAASGLSGYDFDSAAITVSLYSGSSTPGFITWSGDFGNIYIKTYNVSGNPADRIFTFAAFQP